MFEITYSEALRKLAGCEYEIPSPKLDMFARSNILALLFVMEKEDTMKDLLKIREEMLHQVRGKILQNQTGGDTMNKKCDICTLNDVKLMSQSEFVSTYHCPRCGYYESNEVSE